MIKHIVIIIFLNHFCFSTYSFSQTTKAKNDSARETQNTSIVNEEVEQISQFPGGDEEFENYVKKNLNYPTIEKEKGIKGTVYVYFVINTEGKVEDSKIVRGIKDGKALDDEALRLINNMPIWKPGKQKGKLVKYQFTYPVKFPLN